MTEKEELEGMQDPVRRLVATVLLVVVVIAACGPDEPDSTAPSNGSDEKAPQAEPLVGTWERVTKCAELVQAFEKTGLEQHTAETIVANRWIPGLRSADRLARHHPCKGSVPRKHSHYFTKDGEFGSLDWKGEQVDDGTYRILDDDTFVVSDVTFNFQIHGDTIMFDPVIPDCSPRCFAALWSVVVAYPGKKWHRVE